MKQPCKGIGIIMGFILISLNASAYRSEDVPGQFLVKLKNSTSTKAMLKNIVDKGGEATLISESSQTFLVKRPLIEEPSFSVEVLSRLENVEYVEPNQRVYLQSVPNDPGLSELWGLINADKDGARGVDIKALEAWEITTGSRDIVVAVIDTGIDYNHPDLKVNMWVNEAEHSGQKGIDDDANGFIDDIHGYDFSSKNGDPLDDQGHGTHCAGTIGAVGDDGYGIVGVNWNTSLMAIKFLDRRGSGTLDNAIAAIDYAIQNGAKILSNSWGGYSKSKALEEAVQRSHDAGLMFIAAAGNESRDNDNASRALYPASYQIDNVISVASIQRDGKMSWFSNKGANSVHLGAPGTNIYSTVLKGKYDTYSGTSMAAPHVSGVAALVMSTHPSLTHLDVKERLLTTATPLESLDKKTITGGLLNAYEAVK